MTYEFSSHFGLNTNTIKVPNHFLQKKGHQVKICTVCISAVYLQMYEKTCKGKVMRGKQKDMIVTIVNKYHSLTKELFNFITVDQLQ